MDAKEKDPRIKVIKLSRNFGSMAAIQAGLKYTTGDCVGIIAADLQDPPEMFEEMLEHWRTGKRLYLEQEQIEKSLFLRKCSPIPIIFY